MIADKANKVGRGLCSDIILIISARRATRCYASVMLRVLFTVLTISVLSGCVNGQKAKYVEGSVSGVPKSSLFSGWILDHCNGGKPIRIEDLNCPQIGGEIYIVRVSFAKNTEGLLLDDFNSILVVRHGLLISRKNRNRWCFELEPVAADLKHATGTKFISVNYEVGC